MYAAVRDIPLLISEVERLWTLARDARERYVQLHAAAVASITADHAGDPDPLLHLRNEL
jgi:hypothetical protein